MQKLKQASLFSFAAWLCNCWLTNSYADEYRFEAGAAFETHDTDSSFEWLQPSGLPYGLTSSSSDVDTLDFSGTWYYSGLSDTDLLKSRAAFLNRASSTTFSLSHQDLSVSTSGTAFIIPFSTGAVNLPSVNSTSDGSARIVEADFRHVWNQKGWYGLGSIAHIDTERDNTYIDNSGSSSNSSFEFSSSSYTIGAGRYLGEATALDLRATYTDQDFFDTTRYMLSFSHIGSLVGNWKYATDLTVASYDHISDDEHYSLGVSIFPNTDIEFGIRLEQDDTRFSSSRSSVEGFASWFVRDHIQAWARYRTDDQDIGNGLLLNEFDSNRLGFGVNLRF